MNKYSILNDKKYFYSGIFQNNLLFIPAKKILHILVLLLDLIHGNLTECEKEISKTYLNQTAIFRQPLLIIMYY